MFAFVRPTSSEQSAVLPGDDLVAAADAVVMDRAFTLAATPEQVWPWLMQLGKGRGGWYLPRSIERFLPMRRRARRTHAEWQQLGVGDVIPDYGGRDATLEVAAINPNEFIVFTSKRRTVRMSWCIALRPLPSDAARARTRLQFRVRLAPVRRKWLANSLGDLFDLLTIAGLASGLRERLEDRSSE